MGVGILATALWMIQRDSELGGLASPEHDLGAIAMSVREAIELGRTRSRAWTHTLPGSRRLPYQQTFMLGYAPSF